MKISPQQKWSRKQKRKGRCPRCGEKRRHHKHLCDECAVKVAAYMKVWRARRKAQREVVATWQNP